MLQMEYCFSGETFVASDNEEGRVMGKVGELCLYEKHGEYMGI